jgi:hypothetical protein
MIPRARIEKLSKPPPENRFKKPRAPWVLAASLSWCTATLSTPGTRIDTPSR